MRIVIPATAVTREIVITAGPNGYSEPSFSILAHDDADNFFMFALSFRPWDLPTLVYYNGTRSLKASDILVLNPRPWGPAHG